MVLLTFNCKGIDELTGNPPILIEAQEDKVFKDILLEVIDKLNPLLPEGKKLKLEGLGIESFDGEPLSWGTYSKSVTDVIIDFGTSFVVTPKRAQRDESQTDDADIPYKKIGVKSSIDVLDITNEVLKTEGVASKQEAERVARGISNAPSDLNLEGAPEGGGTKAPIDIDKDAGSLLTKMPVIRAMPQPGPPGAAAGPVTSPPVGAPGIAPSPPGGHEAAPSPGLMNLDESQPPASSEGAPVMPSIVPTTPPATAEEKRKGEEKKRKDSGFTRAKLAKISSLESEESEELDEETSLVGTRATKTQYDKSISVDYFDVMNPENYYPVVVDIADVEQAWKPVEENIITGERKVQVKEKAVFETDSVIVRPVFPGCTVAPAELEADLTKPKEVLTFYVTPLVRGGIKGELHFIAKGKIVHKTELPAAVKDPRYGRMITLYGLIASMVPKLSTLFSIDLGAMLSVALGVSLSGETLTSIIAIGGTGIAALFGMVYYATHRPKNAKLQLHVSDFRLSIVPPNVP